MTSVNVEVGLRPKGELALLLLPLATEDALTLTQAKWKEILRLDDARDFRDNAIVAVTVTQPGTAAQEVADSADTVKLCTRSPAMKAARWGSSDVP